MHSDSTQEKTDKEGILMISVDDDDEQFVFALNGSRAFTVCVCVCVFERENRTDGNCGTCAIPQLKLFHSSKS